MEKEKSPCPDDLPARGLLSDEKIRRNFQSAVIGWFRENGGDYPWRKTRDPYSVMVSEMMLQQTRIQTVLDRKYYENWMERFPDCESLAGAEEEEILKLWEGLGYYNRARNLREAARVVNQDFKGVFPETLGDLMKLPGVGRYTAGAVLSFALEKRASIADGNVVRILARLFASPRPVDTVAGQSRMWNWAETLTPLENVREYNSGIMELGQKICSARNPGCGRCPVSKWCLAHRDDPHLFPVKNRAKKATDLVERVVFRTNFASDKIWLVPESGSRRSGLWKLPEITEGEASAAAEILQIKYAITRYRVTLIVYQSAKNTSPPRKEPNGQWFPRNDPKELPPMGSPYSRALDMIGE